MRYANLIGRKFGALTPLYPILGLDKNGANWACQCECGNVRRWPAASLVHGNTKSCGCKTLDYRRPFQSSHGLHGTRTYMSWNNMKARCGNPKNKRYADYGGRGIKVCEAWMSFDAFLADMGECPPGMTIERNDVDGPYEPGNCRWASRKEQQNNMRTNIRIEWRGQEKTLHQWADLLGIAATTLAARIKRGWDVERAMTTPVKTKGGT